MTTPKQPQDHKPAKDAGYSFTVKGRRYTLPPMTEEQAMEVPGEVTVGAVMNPDDDIAQLRLGFANLEASGATDAAKKALRSLKTGEMLEHLGAWLGGSSGSSD